MSTTVTWMWMGNIPVLNTYQTANISALRASWLVGEAGEGGDIAAVDLTAASDRTTGTEVFRASHQGGGSRGLTPPPSRFSYLDPESGEPVTDTMVVAFVDARFAIRVPDDSGNVTVQELDGLLMQTGTGDLFFAPKPETAADWAGISAITGIEVIAAAPFENTHFIPIISYRVTGLNEDAICFGRGALIRTPAGDTPVEALKPGDLVLTRDHGLQAIRWIGSRRLCAAELAVFPRLRPIRIAAGALGEGLPRRDLVVSPQHRILVRSRIARRMFGAPEVLVAARQLLAIEGVETDHGAEEIDYFHLLFARHEVIFANGCEAESLFTGREALRMAGRQAVAEILALFPELREPGPPPSSARPIPPGRAVRGMIRRHIRNHQPLLSRIS